MDLLLTLVICFAQLVLGFMGVQLALRPPKSPANYKYWATTFVIIGVLGIFATMLLAKRAGEAQDKSFSLINQANIAAMNANNSVHDAQKDVREARKEASDAKGELSQLINTRSKETSTAILRLSTTTESSFKAMGALTPAAPRRISPAHRAELIRFLSTKPATVRIQAIVNDAEAYRFAQDWYEVLKASGWTIVGDKIDSFMSARPLQGVNITFRGEILAPSQTAQVSNADPIGHVITAMNALKIVFTGQRLPNIAEGLIVLDFYSRPSAN